MLLKQISTVLLMILILTFATSSLNAQQPSDTAGCCIFVRGNIDHDINDIIDISDLVFMVDIFFSGNIYIISPIKCSDEADIDASGALDISDLVMLVEILFHNADRPPYCDPNISLNVDTRIKISMQENTDEFGTSLLLGYLSENMYPNPCYTIYTSVNSTDNNFVIHFDSTMLDLPEGTHCLTVIGFATGTDNLGQLANGTYNLTLDNGSLSPFQLLVTDEFYQILGYDERQFIIENPILYKAP